MSSGHDQTGQGQSQANTEITTNTRANALIQDDNHQYEDIDNHHVQTIQGQSQAVNEINTNPASLTSGRDYQNDEERNQPDQTVQHQSYTTTESSDGGNPSYGTGAVTTQQNSLYEIQHDQTEQSQSQANTEPMDGENPSYGTGAVTAQQNSLYEIQHE
ncbi:Bax inhibitor 1 [Branchiostoma belcheri]|nr:Bax inhibitor 1 [Branchiostoma belcheri]